MDIGDVSFVDVEQTDERKARRKRLAPDNIKVVNTVKKKKVAVNVSAKKQKVVNEDTQETSTQGVTRTIKRKVKGVLKEVQVKKGIKKKKKKVTLIDFTTFDIQTKVCICLLSLICIVLVHKNYQGLHHVFSLWKRYRL